MILLTIKTNNMPMKVAKPPFRSIAHPKLIDLERELCTFRKERKLSKISFLTD
jgi:hypothetical protein